MERCKTCKHWEAYKSDEWGALIGAGICHAAREIWEVTEEHETTDGKSRYKTLRPEHAGVMSIVEDGSSYRAGLITMPDFGCVQHST